MKTFVVDSFTDKPFSGNPAGVCLVEQSLDEDLMLHIAQELGYSETAFIHALDSDSGYSIRFFSPVKEIPLCGHATLAAARIVFDLYRVTKVCFTNIDNVVLVARSEGREIVLEFPVYETHPAEAPAALLDALGIEMAVNVAYNDETRILLIEINDSGVLANLRPDFTALKQSHDGINGVLVTAPSKTDDYDFHSRYFWPWAGTALPVARSNINSLIPAKTSCR